MKIRQVVRVQILGAPREYTYEYFFDAEAGIPPLGIGDKVELPPNQVQEEGSSGTVVGHGSDYNGPMKEIVRRIPLRGDIPIMGGTHRIVPIGPDDVEIRRNDPEADAMWEGMPEFDQ